MKTNDLLKQKSFLGLFISQATGAFNDNALKMILIGIVMSTFDKSSHSSYISLLNALLIAPFVLFAPLAGWFSDRHSKRSVLITFKATEFIILTLALFALYTQSLLLLFILLVAMGTQSTFYSPAKYGIIKEMIGERRLGQANGLIEMGTIAAIVAGTVGGATLYDSFKSADGTQALVIPLIVLSVFSITGLLFSFCVEKVSSQSKSVFTFKSYFESIRKIRKNKVLLLTIVGITYFWFAAMLLNLLLILFGTQNMGLTSVQSASFLFFYLSIGVSIGSYLAGKASRFRVEVGLIPVGSIGMGISAILLSFLHNHYLLAVLDLVVLGVFGGLFLVPLNTLLQLECDDKSRGSFIAINNMFNNVGMLFSSAVLSFLSSIFLFSPDKILIVLGIFSFAVSIYIFYLLPEAFFRFITGVLTHFIYRIQSINTNIVPETGGVLLTPNHISFVDGILLQYAIAYRKIRFVIYDNFFHWPGLGWFLREAGCIPISETRAKEAVVTVVDLLDKGEIVCIFPEGSLTRLGTLLPFKRGVELILKRAPSSVLIIPVCIDKLWGSIFSFKRKKYFFKIPDAIPYPVSILFGEPQKNDVSAFLLRQRVSNLQAEAFSLRKKDYKTLPKHFIRTAKRFLLKKSVTDSTGKKYSYLTLLVSSLVLSKKIKKLFPNEKMIGVLLPASSAAVIANIAIGLSGKVAVNLNMTTGENNLDHCINACSLKAVFSNNEFIKKCNLIKRDEYIFIEDMAKQTGKTEKLIPFLFTITLPAYLLNRLYGQRDTSPDTVASVIFSSGSTGTPKGIMLSHTNIIVNSDMVSQVLQFNAYDRLLGTLPFFHSFGYTISFWMPLLKGIPVSYVSNPLNAKEVGKTAKEKNCTIMLSTPTFYNLYTRICKKEDFSSISTAIAGAEPLKENIKSAFGKKFGIELLEGYGATEMSPVISCNVPNYSDTKIFQTGTKTGSVGLPLPGISVKVVDPNDYHTPRSPGSEGMLLVTGPNRMLGYLSDEKRTKEAFFNDWYITGDIASVDTDGFIHIVGRESRFSKIAGEMVPHVKIEETINKIIGSDTTMAVVTSVHSGQKGEQLVVLYCASASDSFKGKKILNRLKKEGLPNLWIPKQYFKVDDLPFFATGKLDLRQIKKIAESLFMALPRKKDGKPYMR